MSQVFDPTTVPEVTEENLKSAAVSAKTLDEKVAHSTALLESARAYASSSPESAQRMLDEAKVREELENEGHFSSTINARNMKQLYEEAHAWLEAAKQFKHIEAMRLSGLCYINGWGVEPDKDKGFDMVVQSIEMENSWDKVPEIFAKIGLNKPEFFTALTSHRNQRKG